MSMDLVNQTLQLTADTTFHLKNIREYLSTSRPTRRIGASFGPGFFISVGVNCKSGMRRPFMELYLGILLPIYRDLITTSRFTIKATGYGFSDIFGSDEKFRRTLKLLEEGDAIKLAVQVYWKPLESRNLGDDIITTPLSAHVGRTISQVNDERDVMFILHNNIPKNDGSKPDLRAVYANSNVIKLRSHYFVDQFAFKEGTDIYSDFTPEEMPSFAKHYDYTSDSDLENDTYVPSTLKDEGEDTDSEVEESDSEGGSLKQSEDDADLATLRETETKCLGEIPRSIGPNSGIIDRQGKHTEGGSTDSPYIESSTTAQSTATSNGINTSLVEGISGNQMKWKVIPVPDVGYKTWIAVIYYLYTDIIAFAPLRSNIRQNHDKRNKTYLAKFPDRPALVSCKSIFRVADKLGLEELGDRAVAHLESQLDAKNILHELFSSFTSRYERVKEVEIKYLFEKIPHWKNLPNLKEKMDEVTAGKRAQSTWVLQRIILRMMEPTQVNTHRGEESDSSI